MGSHLVHMASISKTASAEKIFNFPIVTIVKLGESWFDDYWMNYDIITMSAEDGSTRKIRRLEDFVRYRGGDPEQIVTRPTQHLNRRDAS